MNNPIIKPTRARTGGKKSKAKDNRPARKRYWLKRTLEKNKIKNLMKYCKMSKEQAMKFWHSNRKGRVKDGFLLKIA
jgi:hypothetical protein